MTIDPQAQRNTKTVTICYNQPETQYNQSYSLEQEQNYCVSDHCLWLDSLHICLIDLKSRKFNTVWGCGRGTVL